MGTAEVKEYTQRAARLRSERRLDESVLAARKAIELDPDDANAWWQLALSLSDKDGGEAALPSFRKVSELAPDFPGGWYELGRVHHQAARLGPAIAAYERALEEDNEYIPSMRMLAYALKGNKAEGVPARRLALLRTVFERDELDAEDTFDLAYLLGEANETAEAVKVYERYTRDHSGPAAFYNLALDYRALGRDADALDALEAARRSGYDTDNLKTVMAGLQKRLLALRQQVLRRPQPYLQQEDWFQHYINPFSLLNVEPDQVADNPKALQRARQALLREIELEDGKVDWLPGLVIDKSMAIARLTELDNADAWQAHQEVFENQALNEFLMRGSLEHFLIKEDGSTDATLPYLVETEVLERIGSKFAAQFDEVLLRAAEQGDLNTVECLMGGRQWLLPEQQDAAFESTRRLLDRLCEPLKKLVAESETRPFTRIEVQKAFSHGRLGALLMYLPIEFHEAHRAAGRALRELSVTFYNREGDAAEAKAILAMGRRCAQKSPALAHQFEADEKTLDEFIAKEKSLEAHLSFKDRDVSITKAGVVYGKQQLAPADIVGARWGLTQTSARPSIFRLTVAFQARRGEDIVISWLASDNLEEQKKLWGKLVDATNAFILNSVGSVFERQLDSNEYTRVGSVEVRKSGVVLTAKGWFSDKEVLVPWANLSSTLVNGSVVLRDVTNHKATADLPMESTYNAFLLHILANRKERASS